MTDSLDLKAAFETLDSLVPAVTLPAPESVRLTHKRRHQRFLVFSLASVLLLIAVPVAVVAAHQHLTKRGDTSDTQRDDGSIVASTIETERVQAWALQVAEHVSDVPGHYDEVRWAITTQLDAEQKLFGSTPGQDRDRKVYALVVRGPFHSDQSFMPHNPNGPPPTTVPTNGATEIFDATTGMANTITLTALDLTKLGTTIYRPKAPAPEPVTVQADIRFSGGRAPSGSEVTLKRDGWTYFTLGFGTNHTTTQLILPGTYEVSGYSPVDAGYGKPPGYTCPTQTLTITANEPPLTLACTVP